MEIREERRDGQKIQDDTNKAKLKWLVKYLESLDLCLVLRAKNTGSWLTVQGTLVTGTVLLAKGFRNFCPRIMMLPP